MEATAATMLGHQSSTGFYKAPISKGLIGTIFLTSSAIHFPFLAHIQQYIACEIPNVLMSRSIWRIFLNRLTVVYSKDLVCTALVIYYFRIFERRMGSRKFASFLFGSCTITTLLEICSIMLLKLFDVPYIYGHHLPPGLFGIIFPLYVYFFFDIPRTTVTPVLGFPITGKTITYLLGLQVAATSPASFSSAVCGIIAGLLYRYNFLMVQNWLVVPKFVTGVCDRIFGWFKSSEPKYRQMGATIELQRQEQADLWEQQYLARAYDYRPTRGQGFAERLINDEPGGGLPGYIFGGRPRVSEEPSPEHIRILVDMGFDQSRAIEALRSSSNDLEGATSILLRQ